MSTTGRWLVIAVAFLSAVWGVSFTLWALGYRLTPAIATAELPFAVAGLVACLRAASLLRDGGEKGEG